MKERKAIHSYFKPKGKAFNLYFKFIYDVVGDHEKAKQCAIIAVNEILNSQPKIPFIVDGYYVESKKYWKEVKQEIEKL